MLRMQARPSSSESAAELDAAGKTLNHKQPLYVRVLCVCGVCVCVLCSEGRPGETAERV